MSVFIDLSHTIEEGMPVYPDTPLPSFKDFASIERDGFKEVILDFSTHTGTHVDIEAHVIDNGKTIDNYSIDQFYGTAVVIDCPKQQWIEVELLREALDVNHLPDFILFSTGWNKYWGKDEYFKNYPVLNIPAAKYLSKLPLKGLGIDAISFDAYNNHQLTNHKILLKEGLILIENLCGLNRITGEDIIFTCFPLKLKNGDSSPVRACAMIK